MLTNKQTDSAIATTELESHTLHALSQLLEQCKPKHHPDIVYQVKHLLARSCRDYNAQHAPLLKLPAELMIMIGEQVLKSTRPDFDYREKKWLATVLPLMQTCSLLRAQLHPLRLTTLTHWIPARDVSGLWGHVLKEVKAWQRESKEWHTGLTTFIIDIKPFSRDSLKLSAAAALAGALECAIYGRLHKKPAIYIRCVYTLNYRDRPQFYYFGHSREANVLGQWNGYTQRSARRLKTLKKAQGMAVWDKARKQEMV